MVGSASGPGSTFKVFLGSARVRVPLSNKIRVRVGSVHHIYGSLRVRVRIFGPVKTSSPELVIFNPKMLTACKIQKHNLLNLLNLFRSTIKTNDIALIFMNTVRDSGSLSHINHTAC